MFYLIPLFLISFINDYRYIGAIAFLNSILLILGYVLSEDSRSAIVIFHRITGLMMIWVQFTILFTRESITRNLERKQSQLIQANNELIHLTNEHALEQKRLQEIQQDLNKAQSVAQIGSWRLVLRKDTMLLSDEAYRIFGINTNTLLTNEFLFSKVHPHDRQYVDSQWNLALAGAPYDILFRIIVDNNIKWVREKAEFEFDAQGHITAGLGTVQDITDRKKLEETIADQAKFPSENPNPVMRLTPDGIVLYGNQASKVLEKCWNGSLGSTICKPWRHIIHDVYKSGLQKDIQLECGEAIYSLNLVPIVDGGYLNVYGRNITSLLNAEESLRKSEQRLKVLNENLENIVIRRTQQVRILSKDLTIAEQRERKRFSYILHENLQQLLLGAKMLLGQYVHETNGNVPAGESKDIAEILTMLNKALETTRILSIELNPPILRTQGLDSALKWLTKHMRKHYGLMIILQISDSLKMIRNENQLMLTQMTRELLTNVVLYSGVLEAALTAVYDHNQVRIIVSDSGRGFNPAKVLKSPEEGTRLGLFSVRERLRLFGGDLIIESFEGRGTRCEIVLPMDFS